MANDQWHTVISQLRRFAGSQSGGSLSDAHLLEQFGTRRDAAAFEVLVWRHGPAVLGLCRRMLRDAQEAEDAFQATFLTLVRKAGSIQKGQAVGAWLYQVAYRIALRAKADAHKRRSQDTLPDDLPAPAVEDASWQELRPVLDEEVQRLPEKYRLPFVLCYLEGHTNEEAARQLGCPKGTVLSRLARGRERLRQRLTRRGLALAAAGVGGLLSENAAPAAVSAALVNSTVRAGLLFAAGHTAAVGLISARAVALTEGVLRAMWMTKLKTAVALVALAVSLAGTGAVLFAQREADQRPAAARAEEAQVAQVRRGAERGKESPQIRGVLKAVDAAKNTVTLSVSDTGRRAEGERRGPEDKTFAIDQKAEVLFGVGDGRERAAGVRDGKLADLKPGALVTLFLSADRKTAEVVLAEGPTVQGVVKSVDAGKGTVTISQSAARGRGEEPAAEEKTFKLAQGGEVLLDDGRNRRYSIHEGALGDVAPGALATLKLSPDQQTVDTLLVAGPTLRGIVKSVDAGKKTLTVAVGGGGRGEQPAAEEKTYFVAEKADIVIESGKGRFPWRAGKLANVPPGAHVTVRLSVDQTTAMHIVAEGPQVQGVLKSVDPGKGTITLTIGAGAASRDDPGVDKTFEGAKGARVVIDGNESRLEDLKVGADPVIVNLRLALDRKTIRAVTAGVARGR